MEQSENSQDACEKQSMEESSSNFYCREEFSQALDGLISADSCPDQGSHASHNDDSSNGVKESCLEAKVDYHASNKWPSLDDKTDENEAKYTPDDSSDIAPPVIVKEDVDLNRDVDKSVFVTFEEGNETISVVGGNEELNNEAVEQETVELSDHGITAVNQIPTGIDATSDCQVEREEEFIPEEKDVKINVSHLGKKKKGQNKVLPNSLATQMSKHPLLPPCQCNKRKCGEQFSYDMRRLVHEKFWTMNMYERREWTSEHLLYLKPKSRTNKPVSTLHESHRKFFLPNVSGKLEVCRRMFFSTLGFKDEAKFLQNPKHLNKQGMLSRTRKRKCVMSRKNLDAVEAYCKELREKHGTHEIPGATSFGATERLRESSHKAAEISGMSSQETARISGASSSGTAENAGTSSHETAEISGASSRGTTDSSGASSHGTTEGPGISSPQVVIPSGFSLRDMYNDFCVKKSVSSFGYHRFRQILELFMRGERVEDCPFADLKDDEETVNEGAKKKRKRVIHKVKERKSKKDKSKTSESKDSEDKNRRKKENKTQKDLPEKSHSILKLPLFDKVKYNFLNKRNRKKELPNTSSRSTRYNFRDCLSTVKTYCEEDMMESQFDSEEDTYDDMISVTFEESREENSVVKKKPKIRLVKAKKLKIKIKKERSEKKVIKITKERKQRKKKQKTAERLEQIRFAESRKKSGVNHPVLPPCKCNLRKCHEKIPDDQRQLIHDDFWKQTTKQEKKNWVEKHVMHCKPRSRSNFVKFPRKHFFRKYSFPTAEGKMTSVCRVFFMRTLGYHSNMTIDAMEMNPNDIPGPVHAKKDETDQTRKDPGGQIPDREPNDKDKELVSAKTAQADLIAVNDGKENDESVSQDDSLVNHLDEKAGSQYQFGPNPKETASFVFFTPDIEKKEVEKATNPAMRRRRPLSQRNSKEHHPMREPCSCAKKCLDKIPQNNREVIHEHYWSLISYNQRKQWILEHIKREVPKRRTVLTGPVRKKETRRCFLPSLDGNKMEVCRAFFLSTLGFKWDKMIDTICKTTPQDSKYVRADQRGKRAPVHKLQDVVLENIREYLESIFQTLPFIPPQARDPLKRPVGKKKKSKNSNQAQGGLTIKTLYSDYKLKHPDQKVSYASFRKVHCQVRDEFKAQHPEYNEDHTENIETAPSQPIGEAPHSDMSVSPCSDNGFSYEQNDAPARTIPNTTISPLQSCMYNEEPQLLNLSYANNIAKANHHHVEVNPRQGLPSGIKFSKTQDFHLLPFSSYDKAAPKGQSMYHQIHGHPSAANIMPQYTASQNTPLDPFYMASTSQTISNPIAYSNLHFPTDLINHPHLHHPVHHHPPHLYQSALPYRDHNRFPSSVLPQALKEQEHNNHHFYQPSVDYELDTHPAPQDSSNIYPFKDPMSYQSFTPDNATQSPVPNQIPNQLTFPGNNVVNVIEQRNGASSQGLSASGFVENTNTSCLVSNVKVPNNYQGQIVQETMQDQHDQKDVKKKPEPKVKRKSSKKSKKEDDVPKVPKVRKVRPVSNRNSKEHHPMLPPCTCGKKCCEKIEQSQREVIYEAFWELGSYNSRKQWIAERMTREDPKRRTNLEALVMRKKETRRFNLPNSSNEMTEVCRLFFLHTLGLKWDKMIGTICKTTARDNPVVPPDMRGKKPPAHKLNDEVSRSVESYAKALLQAAKPEYLANVHKPDNPKKFSLDSFIPYGLTMKNLHLDYKAKHASHKVSYESFRKIFREIRKVVLDPDSVEGEDKEDGDSAQATDIDQEVPQGTINAATGHIDSAF